MALLGSRVPVTLKVFLLALAIIDDLGVIVIIALFYSSDLSTLALAVAFASTAALFIMNAKNVTKISWYVVVGLILWVSVLKSGVHATLAGVVLGFAIPLSGDNGLSDEHSPLKKMEHALHPYVAFFILPVFAFANAGISLEGVSLSGLTSMLPLGIALGLMIGKPLGIFTASYLAIKPVWQVCRKALGSGRFLRSQYCVVSVLPCLSSSRRWPLLAHRRSSVLTLDWASYWGRRYQRLLAI